MDHTSCLEVYGLWKGDCMKNKAFLVKSALWLLSFMYTCSICISAVYLFKRDLDFSTISFLTFSFVACFFCMRNSAKNISEYTWNKLKEKKDD